MTFPESYQLQKIPEKKSRKCNGLNLENDQDEDILSQITPYIHENVLNEEIHTLHNINNPVNFSCPESLLASGSHARLPEIFSKT